MHLALEVCYMLTGLATACWCALPRSNASSPWGSASESDEELNFRVSPARRSLSNYAKESLLPPAQRGEPSGHPHLVSVHLDSVAIHLDSVSVHLDSVSVHLDSVSVHIESVFYPPRLSLCPPRLSLCPPKLSLCPPTFSLCPPPRRSLCPPTLCLCPLTRLRPVLACDVSF